MKDAGEMSMEEESVYASQVRVLQLHLWSFMQHLLDCQANNSDINNISRLNPKSNKFPRMFT
jgi:hypothetical protein